MKRNPYLAAILNALLYGLGYVYLGKKMFFGIFLIFSCIFAIAFFAAGIEEGLVFLLHPLMLTSIILSCVAFAYDAFEEARKEIKKEEKQETEEE